MDKKPEILEVNGSWKRVLELCRSTVGKEGTGKEPSDSFKRRILIAEHSPIRHIKILWRWDKLESWIATHWSRHMWECFIESQRSDRTGVDRRKLPQDQLVKFTGEANVQHLIDTMRKRLCYQAASETRETAEELKTAIHEIEPEISDVLVPNCVYRGGCPELNCCGYFTQLLVNGYNVIDPDIQKRYGEYNRAFWDKRKEGREDAEEEPSV